MRIPFAFNHFEATPPGPIAVALDQVSRWHFQGIPVSARHQLSVNFGIGG